MCIDELPAFTVVYTVLGTSPLLDDAFSSLLMISCGIRFTSAMELAEEESPSASTKRLRFLELLLNESAVLNSVEHVEPPTSG